MKLKAEIEIKRNEMIRSGMSKGLCAEETILLSQELDRLINKSMKLSRSRKEVYKKEPLLFGS